MTKYTYIEPRIAVSDAALASGDRNAWRQILGLAGPNDPPVKPDREPPPLPGDFIEDDIDIDDDDDDEDDDDE